MKLKVMKPKTISPILCVMVVYWLLNPTNNALGNWVFAAAIRGAEVICWVSSLLSFFGLPYSPRESPPFLVAFVNNGLHGFAWVRARTCSAIIQK